MPSWAASADMSTASLRRYAWVAAVMTARRVSAVPQPRTVGRARRGSGVHYPSIMHGTLPSCVL